MSRSNRTWFRLAIPAMLVIASIVGGLGPVSAASGQVVATATPAATPALTVSAVARVSPVTRAPAMADVPGTSTPAVVVATTPVMAVASGTATVVVGVPTSLANVVATVVATPDAMATGSVVAGTATVMVTGTRVAGTVTPVGMASTVAPLAVVESLPSSQRRTTGTFRTRNHVTGPFSSLVAGTSHTCGLVSGGAAYCWGHGGSGQLGDGTQTKHTTPAPVSGGLAFTSLAAGANHTCALVSGGAAYCWGTNWAGQLGDGTNQDRITPVAVSGGVAFTSLVAGGIHTCGLTSGGTAYCWGYNGQGQLGDGTSGSYRNAPASVSGGLAFTSLVAGNSHTCGLITGGTAYCWGYNYYGQIGDGTSGYGSWYQFRNSPVVVSGGLAFTGLVAGGSHTCGLISGGTAYCWGDNENGQLGDGSGANRTTPVAVSGGLSFTSLVAGDTQTCGVASGDTAHCWGSNYYGQLGDGATDQRTTPVAVSGGRTFTSLVAGEGASHTCGLATSGTAYCWGYNYYGQLGDGTQTDRTSPVSVDVSAIPVPFPGLASRMVRIANVQATSFTVSWQTESPTTGSVRWSIASNGGSPATMASDRRGAATSSPVHIVTVSGLLPQTTYLFDLASGDASDANGGSHYAVSTGPTLSLGSPDSVFGKVAGRNGGLPAGALVHVSASGASGTSGTLSTVVTTNDAGIWVVDLANLRSAAGDERYPVSDTTVLTVVADGGTDGSATGTVPVSGARSGTLTLRLDNEFRFALEASWNLVTLVATPAERLTAQGVCHSLDEVASGSAVEVYRWENGGWEGHVCGVPPNDFTLEVGRGYFLRLAKPSQWAYQGLVESVPATLPLVTGWNLVGPAVVSAVPSTASGSCATFTDEAGSGTALEVARWVDGGWEGHRCDLPPNDFTLEAGRGYFVRLTRPTHWTPVGKAPTNAVSSRSVQRSSPVTTPVATPAPVIPPGRMTPQEPVARP